MRSLRLRSSGFTLIEVLVTILVASLLLSAVYAAFVGSLSARDRCEDLARDHRLCQGILALLERDLQGAFAPPGTPVCLAGTSETSQGGSADRVEFATTSDARRAVEGRGSDHCEVGYRAEPDPDAPGLLRLIRREEHGFAGELTAGGTLEVLADRVKSFRLEYLGTDGQWATEWQGEGLPLAVRATVAVLGDPSSGGDPGMETALATVIVLPAGG
jgi:prepilin-type N-terminal cleavage/methylation domain-containing protein